MGLGVSSKGTLSQAALLSRWVSKLPEIGAIQKLVPWTWRIILVCKWLEWPPFSSHNKAIWKRNNPIRRGLTITMVINHLLTWMIVPWRVTLPSHGLYGKWVPGHGRRFFPRLIPGTQGDSQKYQSPEIVDEINPYKQQCRVYGSPWKSTILQKMVVPFGWWYTLL